MSVKRSLTWKSSEDSLHFISLSIKSHISVICCIAFETSSALLLYPSPCVSVSMEVACHKPLIGLSCIRLLIVHLRALNHSCSPSPSLHLFIFNASITKSSRENEERTGETSHMSQWATLCSTALIFSSYSVCPSRFLSPSVPRFPSPWIMDRLKADTLLPLFLILLLNKSSEGHWIMVLHVLSVCSNQCISDLLSSFSSLFIILLLLPPLTVFLFRHHHSCPFQSVC